MTSAMVLCRFLHFTVVLLLFGAWVFRPLLLRRDSTLDPALACVSRWLAFVALASGVGWLLLVTASMAGTWCWTALFLVRSGAGTCCSTGCWWRCCCPRRGLTERGK